MPEYSDQLPVHDRWAVVAYIRALELSRQATLADVPPDQRVPWRIQMSTPYDPSSELENDAASLAAPALAAGAILLVASMIGAFFSPGDFFHGYLIGFLFWLGAGAGSMAFLMLQYLTGGAWGVVTRRTFESATRTLPLLAALFMPLAFGLPYSIRLGPSRSRAADDLLRHRAPT